jgi:ribose-phosphate pyrophosphokinase
MILGFEAYKQQVEQLAGSLDMGWDLIQVHYFPDGEVKLTLPAELPEHVGLYCTLDRPNEKLIELLLAADTAREQGVGRLTLIAPYLCYMRQDKAFHPGESISQRSIGGFLGNLFEVLITIDPHLHRIRQLEQVIPDTEVITLSATALMAEFLQSRGITPLLLGPDAESEQWVAAIAEPMGLDYHVCSKIRTGDHNVSISLPTMDFVSRHVVLVDDVVSSGETLAVAARQCLQHGAERVDVLVTHPLFAEQAMEHILQAGVTAIWSTDSIIHKTNTLSLTRLLSEHLKF